MWKLNKTALDFYFGADLKEDEIPALVAVADARLSQPQRDDRRVRNRAKAERAAQRRSGGSTGTKTWMARAKEKHKHARTR